MVRKKPCLPFAPFVRNTENFAKSNYIDDTLRTALVSAPQSKRSHSMGESKIAGEPWVDLPVVHATADHSSDKTLITMTGLTRRDKALKQ